MFNNLATALRSKGDRAVRLIQTNQYMSPQQHAIYLRYVSNGTHKTNVTQHQNKKQQDLLTQHHKKMKSVVTHPNPWLFATAVVSSVPFRNYSRMSRLLEPESQRQQALNSIVLGYMHLDFCTFGLSSHVWGQRMNVCQNITHI